MKKILLYIICLFALTNSLISNGQNFIINSYTNAAQDTGVSLSSANVRFIVGNSASLTSVDNSLKDILDANIGTVQVVNDVQAEYDLITDHDFTVIAESISSSTVASLVSETKPIITVEGSNWDEFLLGSSGTSNTAYGTSTISNTHPITTGVSSPFDFHTGGASNSAGQINLSGTATSTAYLCLGVDTTYLVIAFDTGDTLSDSSTAASKRVFMSGFSANLWSSDTQLIFLNTLKWFYGITP